MICCGKLATNFEGRAGKEPAECNRSLLRLRDFRTEQDLTTTTPAERLQRFLQSARQGVELRGTRPF